MKLAYLTSCFGTPSHTFIRREIREFESRGIPVALYGVNKDTNIAHDAEDLVARTRYLYPLAILATLAANLYFASRFASRYWPALLSCFAPTNGVLKNRLKLAYHLVVACGHARNLLDNEITHIHAHFLNVSSSIAMFCSRLTTIPYSITVHSAGERDLPHVIAIPAKLKYADKLLMISEFNIRYYNDIYPCSDKAHVVRCGMEIDQFNFRSYQDQLQSPISLLAVGRFVEKKGFHILVKAADILNKQGQAFIIEILGSGPMHEQIAQAIKEQGLEGKVSLPGQASTEEVKQKMLAADAVIVPSVTSASGEMEGIPVVLMEAMASGVPVIATAHSGIPELVSDETGILVAENDADALAAAIASFAPNEARTQNARALIESQFNIHKVVDTRQRLFSH